jgi:ubiquinone/menaquinone biosynthesis C-methylase UbiE
MLHCIDASPEALGVAKRNLADQKNCEYHEASVAAMPVPIGSMDFGYSLGVLHHVPDTAQAIGNCARVLKSGAPFLVYLYYSFDNRPGWFRAIWHISNWVRRVVSRLPFGIRSSVADVIAIVIYWPLARIAVIAEKAGFEVDVWPLSSYRNRALYTMRTDALDRFGTQLEQRFSRIEIQRMMEDAGFRDIEFREQAPYWCAMGYKK